MKRTIISLFGGRTVRVGIVTAFILLAGQPCVGAKSTPFSRIITFGDSLSDTGNFFALNGGVRPPPPYFEGRVCNGLVWVEYLARQLGMAFVLEDNYAVAGATTGTINFNDGFLGLEYPGLQEQIAEFLADIPPGGADADALYIVWAGANDVFVTLETGGNPADLIANGVGNTVQAIQSLWAAGARHILVPNLPDVGITPLGQGSGAGTQITAMCAAYNEVLEVGLESLAQAGIPTIRINAFETLRRMVFVPEEFGFTNTADPLLFVVIGGGVAQPAAYVFWDEVHPTTRAHEVLAEDAAAGILDYFSPSQGQKTPPARLDALNGLVRASN